MATQSESSASLATHQWHAVERSTDVTITGLPLRDVEPGYLIQRV